ncbi:MAG: enoyl-CoA hydratase/isomerase family protein [Chloroflexi bacterium]|nr:enoyl-CoA hydratase/isomerase family protein [Chloroflexota bacterium]
MSEPTVLYSKDGPIARITLNRPRVINAYNTQMRDELYSKLEAARDDPDARVVIISGAGERGFCAGADLTEFGTAPSLVIARRVRWERDVWGLFLSIRKPLIAALHGYVIGSGVEIACLCDIRIASEDAVFRMPEVALGMVPAAGGTQTLPRIIGPGPALEMILTNRVVAADEARRLGLIHKVVPRSMLHEEAEQIARALASRSPETLSAAKSAVLEGADMPLEQALALEERLAARVLGR